MNKMTAQEFGQVPLPTFSDATQEGVTRLLRTIDNCAFNAGERELARIAMQTCSLIENFRLHPSAACDLVRTIAQATYSAMVKAEDAAAD